MLEIVQHFGTALSSLGWTMYFHFDFYPADLLSVIIGRTAEEAGISVQEWLTGLIANDPSSIKDERARELANRMLKKCVDRTHIYTINGKAKSKRTEAKKEKTLSDVHPKQIKPVEANEKPKKHPLFFDNVNVTDNEETALRIRFGSKIERACEILSNYKESTGKTYKSDAAALRGWVADKLRDEERKVGFKAQERNRDALNAADMLTDKQKEMYGL